MKKIFLILSFITVFFITGCVSNHGISTENSLDAVEKTARIEVLNEQATKDLGNIKEITTELPDYILQITSGLEGMKLEYEKVVAEKDWYKKVYEIDEAKLEIYEKLFKDTNDVLAEEEKEEIKE